MEKFGIFELLDALAAITEDAAKPDEDAPAAPKTPDESYLPPAYGGETPAQNESGKRAIDDFLARHERAAEKKR